MIQIKGQWEHVESKEDCMKIIRENLGEEFTTKAEEIIEFKPRVPEELEDAINDLKKTRNKIDDVIQYLHEWKRDILEPE